MLIWLFMWDVGLLAGIEMWPNFEAYVFRLHGYGS